jgi:hypothetical protein
MHTIAIIVLDVSYVVYRYSILVVFTVEYYKGLVIF